MDYTHKFTSGPLRMEDVIENYFSLRKARGKCLRCEKYNKYWSCPEFGFSEKVLLEQFQYLYVIGREYTVPKEHKQTITGVVRTKNYIEEVRERMNTEGWRDLLEIEKDYPNVMILRPGNCNICEAAGIKCAKKSHERCRHSELMRFSIESLGLDADSIAKFEVGMLLNWPTDSHLPEKIACLMGVLTNERIPMAQLKSYFPDAKKSYLKAGQTILGGEDAPKAKRADSWLEHQAEELRVKEEEEGEHGSWLGFKDQSLDSGDFVKNRPWAQNDNEYPDAPPDLGDKLEGDLPPEPKAAPQAPPDVAPKPMSNEATADQGGDGDPKYKWLGFKRSVEEADEMMRERPIPKFNISPEEKAAQDAQIEAQMHPEAYAAKQAQAQAQAAQRAAAQAQQQPVYNTPQDNGNVGAGQNVQFENTGTTANVNADKYSGIREALAQTIRTAMPNATDADVAKLLDATLKTAQAKRERKEHLAPGSQGATVLSNPPGRDPEKQPEPQQPQQPQYEQAQPQPQMREAPRPQPAPSRKQPVYPTYEEPAQPVYQAPQDPYTPREQPQATQQQEVIRRPQAQPTRHDNRRRSARPAQKRKVRRVRRVVKPKPQPKPQQPQTAKKSGSSDPLAAALAIAQAVVADPKDAAPEVEVQTADQYDVPQDDGSYVVEEIEEYYDDADGYQTDYDDSYQDDGYDTEPAYQETDDGYAQDDGGYEEAAPRPEPEPQAPPEPVDPNDLKGDDDTRYKWLGFKANIDDGDNDMPKGSWRDRKQY